MESLCCTHKIIIILCVNYISIIFKDNNNFTFHDFWLRIFVQSTVEMSRLCSLVPGASTMKKRQLNSQRLESSRAWAGDSQWNPSVAVCSMSLLQLPHSLLAMFQNQTSQHHQGEHTSLCTILSWNFHSTASSIVTNPQIQREKTQTPLLRSSPEAVPKSLCKKSMLSLNSISAIIPKKAMNIMIPKNEWKNRVSEAVWVAQGHTIKKPWY